VGGGLGSLPTGSMVATGSARRRTQLANLRPDLTFTGLRGNLATRLRAVGTGGVAAVVVAKAALDRLRWSPGDGTPVEVLDAEMMIPQVGQGALAVECRAEDEATRQALAAIDDRAVRALVTTERAFLSELGGGCTLPVGAHANFVAPGPESTAGVDLHCPIALTGMLASGDGLVVLRHRSLGDQPEDLGRTVARYLLEDGGGSQFVEWERPPPAGAPDDSRVEG
jgi:hydroxymethylbilane synthase